MAEEINADMEPGKPGGQIRGIWAILIIVVAAMLVGGGVWYWFYKTTVQDTGNLNTVKLSSSPSASASSSVSPSTSSSSETANWQIYSNSIYKVSIKYPTDWKYTEEKTDNQGSVPNYTTVHFYEKSKATSIENSINAGGIADLDEIQLLIIDGTSYNTTLTQFKNYNCTIEEDKVISGTSGKYFYCKPQGANSTYYYIAGKNNVTFDLRTTYTTKKDTLGKMIDTFKFL
ncbi:MAG: hypothetical protein NT039_01050 [Candidatus Berkelbacteria bacterium]|nr:hypothetical protein [Candidatus Berkelbacteria bacterium]